MIRRTVITKFLINLLILVNLIKNSTGASVCAEDLINARHVDVLILGAGAAGLGAARKIQSKQPHLDFLVLEGADYPGGRIKNDYMTNTDPTDTERVTISAGAQWLHGRWNPLHNFSLHHNLLVYDNSEEALGPFMRDDKIIIEDTLVDTVDLIVEEILNDAEKFYNERERFKVFPRSLNQFLDTQFAQKISRIRLPGDKVVARQLLDWHKRWHAIDFAVDDFKKISAKEWGRFWDVRGRYDHISFRNGFAEVMHLMAAELGPDKIQYNKIVEKIHWGMEPHSNPINYGDTQKKVLVKTRDGSWYIANHVIVTFSLGVLKKTNDKMFNPSLPPLHKDAINCLGFGPITKIFLQFENNFWGDKEGIQFVWRNQNNYKTTSWIRYMTGFDKVMLGTNMFIGWVGQQGTMDMEKLSDKEIIDQLVKFMRTFTGKNVPYPKRYFISRWHNNPLTYGSYSYQSIDCDPNNITPKDLATPIVYWNTWGNVDEKFTTLGKPLLLFAGEGTSQNYFSTAHGAYLTGENQACVVMKYKNNNLNDC